MEKQVGRYLLSAEIASGGMGTVHLGHLRGEAGFARAVAIKRLHPHYAREDDFRRMFIDEARLASRVRHPNVVPTLDVVVEGDELFVVMEYVHGAPLSYLLQATRQAGRPIPVRIASAIASGLLQGLHAAHEAVDEKGQPLGLVHRDVSPQNVIVGADGATRVLDFGVAKAAGRLQSTTAPSTMKGKLAYAAPEQIRGEDVTRLTDLYAAGVVTWELFTGKRLFTGDHDGALVEQILVGWVDPPSRWDPAIPEALDEAILRALSTEPSRRFRTTREMAMAIERCVPAAPAMEVAEWVERLAWDLLETRRTALAIVEGHPSSGEAPPPISSRREDPSSISVSQPVPKRGRRRVVGLVLLAFVTASLAFVLARPAAKKPVSAVAAASPPTSTASPEASTAPSVSAAPTATEPSTVVLPVVSVPSLIAPTHKIAPSKPPPSVAPKPVDPPSDCTPPYTYDELGRRIYKRHCLGK
ncbi:MAG: protein kinase [Myxococcales bacterium]|nr:protein kinase [Myxococcales bacterium]